MSSYPKPAGRPRVPAGDLAVSALRLTRRFPARAAEVTALEDVDFTAPWAALTAVVGPSGCGKSTLLNLVGLLDRPDAGRLVVAGTDVTSFEAQRAAMFRRDHIGFLFQDGGLIERMTVADNVGLPLAYRGASARERVGRVGAALERVGLLARATSLIDELSGGERQRVGFARAVVAAAPILVCDEPTASLDAENARLVSDLLVERAAAGAAVVCASHEPGLIARANHRITLSFGRVVETHP